MARACCCLAECRCFRFSNHFIYLEFLYWIDAGIAAAQHSLWSYVDCYCHSQLNTMYGSYLKFLKTHKTTKKKGKNEQEILINCSVSSMRSELLRQAFIILSVRRGVSICLYMRDCESVCVKGDLLKLN